MPQEAISKTQNLELTAPEKLTDNHDFSGFDCGEMSINEYGKRAHKAQLAKDAVVYVACLKGTSTVVAFYTLTNGSVMRSEAPKAMQRNAPSHSGTAGRGQIHSGPRDRESSAARRYRAHASRS